MHNLMADFSVQAHADIRSLSIVCFAGGLMQDRGNVLHEQC